MAEAFQLLKLVDQSLADLFKQNFGEAASDEESFDTYEEYIEASKLAGRAVRFSEIEFNKRKANHE